MAVLPIHEFPEAVLRRKAEPVMTLDDTLQRLIDDMIQTMYDAPGIGLAAPQVGVSLQLFVVDVTSGRDANALMTFINPGIIKAEGGSRKTRDASACRGCMALHTSHACGRARYESSRETVEVEGEGLLARAFQHEMDHLQGMLFFNRMGQRRVIS